MDAGVPLLEIYTVAHDAPVFPYVWEKIEPLIDAGVPFSEQSQGELTREVARQAVVQTILLTV